MVKIGHVLLPLMVLGTASAFAPGHPKAFVRPESKIHMSDDEDGGKIVPIKEETVEFTAGILGGVAGFAVGGPWLAAIGAAAANYVAKQDTEVSQVTSAVSKSAIEVYNYLAKLDSKYDVLMKAKSSLQAALDKAKASQADPSTIDKVEGALKTTTEKISEINDEYDLVGSATTALGVFGDLVEKAVEKAGELNEEYNLSNKAKEAISKAVEKAKDSKTIAIEPDE